MRVLHQTGFRESWNIDCYNNGIGDGIIFSPVNISSDKLLQIEIGLKNSGFLDPQLYLLNEAKGTLDTYPYFPGNLKSGFKTIDLTNDNYLLAKTCIDFQILNEFQYLVIPTRYYSEYPSSFLSNSTEHFINPFCDYIKETHTKKKVLLSIIVKSAMLSDEIKRDEVLNWITGHQGISGVYLIFENDFSTKQIKDFEYLLDALKFINILKNNLLEVHLGYCNTEGILYSIAMPDSVSIGSYENLRSFGIKRFQDLEKGQMRGPRARIYSSKLLQWIDHQYLQAMRRLLPNYEDLFDDSEYKPLMFSPEFNWHFGKPEIYKHYFTVYYSQLKDLEADQNTRINEVKSKIQNAIELFSSVLGKVLLDEDSDGSHLPTWYNVIKSFEAEIQ